MQCFNNKFKFGMHVKKLNTMQGEKTLPKFKYNAWWGSLNIKDDAWRGKKIFRSTMEVHL